MLLRDQVDFGAVEIDTNGAGSGESFEVKVRAGAPLQRVVERPALDSGELRLRPDQAADADRQKPHVDPERRGVRRGEPRQSGL
jgi:hypothetical protein